jgi:hypothetical protein
VSVPPDDGWARIGNPKGPLDAETFIHRAKQLSAIRSVDMGRWHLSVAHRERVPTWGELGFARDALIPADVWMMVPHPPREFWLNLDRRVLHMWQFRDAKLVEQFQWEGEQAKAMGIGSPDDGETR